MKRNLMNKKGITLIALVITIIVLLILAGVTIAMLTGQNGILTQANNAKVAQSHGAVKDSIALAYNEYQIEINTGSTEKIASTTKVTVQGKEENYLANSNTFMDFLLAKGYIESKETGKINVEKLTGAKQALGNGTGETDVYKVAENEGIYTVNYYNEVGSPEEIYIINSTTENTSAVKTVEILDISQIVTYTIQYEEGMTWGEWIDSKYNTISFYIDGDIIKGTIDGDAIDYPLQYIAENHIYSYVETNQKIDENIIYGLVRTPV